MPDAGGKEQPSKFLRAAEGLLPHLVIVPALRHLAGNQPLVVGDSVQHRHTRIGKALPEEQLAAVRPEFFEIGRVGIEDSGQGTGFELLAMEEMATSWLYLTMAAIVSSVSAAVRNSRS